MRGESVFTRSDPDILELGGSGGPRLLAAVLALSFGAGFLAWVVMTSGVVGQRSPEAPPGAVGPDLGMLVSFGLLAVLGLIAGLGILLGRRHVAVDRRFGRVVTWWGTGVSLFRREQVTSAFDRVDVVPVQREKSPPSYRVHLTGPGVAKPLKVLDSQDGLLARRAGEELADHVHLPLHDVSSGVEVVREPGRLDESLAERSRRLGEGTTLPAAPAAMRASVAGCAEGIRVELPAGSNPLKLVALLPFSVFFMIMLLSGLASGRLRVVVAALVLLAMAVGAATAYVRAGRSTRFGATVTAGPARLLLEDRSPFNSRVVEIASDHIEELLLTSPIVRVQARSGAGAPDLAAALATSRLPDGRPIPSWAVSLAALVDQREIVVRSDSVEVRFGKGLPASELDYLQAVLRQAITGM
jgi:hypothetical protein